MAEEKSKKKLFEYEWRRVVTSSAVLPSVKANGAGVYLNGDLWLFGGKGAGQLNEAWRFCRSRKAWQQMEYQNTPPVARDGHSVTKISSSNLILYGGQGQLVDGGKFERQTEHGKLKSIFIRQLLDDMYEFDSATMKWTSIPRSSPRPTGRRGHTMTYLPSSYVLPVEGFSSSRGSLVLFGGSCIDQCTGCERGSNDLWLFSLDTRTWTQPIAGGTPPPQLVGHQSIVHGDYLYVIGGATTLMKGDRLAIKGKHRSLSHRNFTFS